MSSSVSLSKIFRAVSEARSGDAGAPRLCVVGAGAELTRVTRALSAGAAEVRGGVSADLDALAPADYPLDAALGWDEADAILIAGGSCIVSPFGEVLAGPARDSEAILVADLDLDDIARGTFDLDTVGHYARPDVFRLVVDERPTRPVVVAGGEAGTDPIG